MVFGSSEQITRPMATARETSTKQAGIVEQAAVCNGQMCRCFSRDIQEDSHAHLAAS
jgi:hypothetical protein